MDKALRKLKERVSKKENQKFHGHCYLCDVEERLVKERFEEIHVKDCDLSLEWIPIFMDTRTKFNGTYGECSYAKFGYRYICFETMQMRGETMEEYYRKK